MESGVEHRSYRSTRVLTLVCVYAARFSFVFATPGAYGKSTTLTLIRMACLLKG
jgi:hypothetical protein